MSRITEDLRIDPRLKAIFGNFPAVSQPNVSSREEVIERLNSPQVLEARTSSSRDDG